MATVIGEHSLVFAWLLHWRSRYHCLLPIHRHPLARLGDHDTCDLQWSLNFNCTLRPLILLRQMTFNAAFKTAIGMSLISMVGMELAMNLVDVAVTGGAILTLEVIPLMLLAGFLAPLPYNYWRLKALGKACH